MATWKPPLDGAVHVAIRGLGTMPRSLFHPVPPGHPTPAVHGAGLGSTVQSGPSRRLGFRSSVTQLSTVRTGPKVGLLPPLFHPLRPLSCRIGPSPQLADPRQSSCCPLVVVLPGGCGRSSAPTLWARCPACPSRKIRLDRLRCPCRLLLGATVSPWMSWIAVSRNTAPVIAAIIRAIQCLTTMTRSYLEPHGHESWVPRPFPEQLLAWRPLA